MKNGTDQLSDSARGMLSLESDENHKMKTKDTISKRVKSIKTVHKEMDEFSKYPGVNKSTMY